jgi:hypothetical protein
MIGKLAASAIITVSLLALGIMAYPGRASAAVAPGCKSGSFLGFPAWYEYLDIGKKEIKDKRGYVIATDDCGIIGPLDSNGNLDWSRAGGRIGIAVVDILLRISGMMAVAFIIYGGVQYVLSEGDAEKAKKARGTIFNALIGLILVMVATAIVALIGNTLTK